MERKCQKSEDLYRRIDNALEDLLIHIYYENRIETGEIMPGQYLKWRELCSDMAGLFDVLIIQNRDETRRRKQSA